MREERAAKPHEGIQADTARLALVLRHRFETTIDRYAQLVRGVDGAFGLQPLAIEIGYADQDFADGCSGG